MLLKFIINVKLHKNNNINHIDKKYKSKAKIKYINI